MLTGSKHKQIVKEQMERIESSLLLLQLYQITEVKTMKLSRINELRIELDNERIDLMELSEIEAAFAELPDESLRDLRENAMAGDMLDELEAAL